MKQNTKSTQSKTFRIHGAKSLADKKNLWLDLHGCSHMPVATTPTEAAKFAQQLREAAQWVETYGKRYLGGKPSKTTKRKVRWGSS